MEEIKNRTKLLPLYPRAYCHAINISSERPKRIEGVDETVFKVLYGRLSFLAGQLSDGEIMLLCALDEGKWAMWRRSWISRTTLPSLSSGYSSSRAS